MQQTVPNPTSQVSCQRGSSAVGAAKAAAAMASIVVSVETAFILAVEVTEGGRVIEVLNAFLGSTQRQSPKAEEDWYCRLGLKC